MKPTDATRPDCGTHTHPYVAAIAMDPAMYGKFQRTFEDHPEVELLGVDLTKPDTWTVYAACASRLVQDLLESNW